MEKEKGVFWRGASALADRRRGSPTLLSVIELIIEESEVKMSKQLTFEEAYALVMQHIKARKWDKTNSSRGLAVSLSLEANELLEYFQWHDESFGSKEDMASELADILIYAIQFADRYKIDIPSAIQKKIEKQDKKYPVEIFAIEDEKERNKAWLEAKKNYKKDTTL